jgi:hypothetical protein
MSVPGFFWLFGNSGDVDLLICVFVDLLIEYFLHVLSL